MGLSRIGLLIYLAYLPCLTLLIFWATKRRPGFFASKHLLSALAETSSPSFEIVSFLIALFSLLRIFFIFNLAKLLPPLLTSKMGLFFLYASCFGSLLVAFFPRDKFRQVHGVFGTLLFAGILGSVLFLAYPFRLSPEIPNLIILLNALIAGLVFLVLTSDYLTLKKLGGFVAQYRFVWQWSLLLLIIIWDATLALITFLYLVN